MPEAIIGGDVFYDAGDQGCSGPAFKDIHYLGWCHGPPGTARLWYRLWQVTRDPRWLGWLARLKLEGARTPAPELH